MKYNAEYSYIKNTGQFQYWLFVDENGANSRLYVKNWRVPDNIPYKVDVTIIFEEKLIQDLIVKEEDVNQSPELKKESISIVMKYITKHSDTVQYNSKEEKSGVHSLYVPQSFFETEIYPKEIKVIIEWEL